jgi:multicomponent Na+:H+ antiporter subunit G
MSVADIVSAVFMLLSAVLALLASLGLWRFDDLFSRIHASTKATTLGVLLVVAAAALQVEFWGDVMRLLLAAILQLISAPVAGHMLGRADYWARPEVTRDTVIDQLGGTRGVERRSVPS